MGHWLAQPGKTRTTGTLKRFDARYWTVNFPRPMMASVVTTGPNALRIDALFYRQDDLAGLIWHSADSEDHPLIAYETDRDFRACVLKFRWRSGGLKPLDALDGPTLTIEGRDSSGEPRTWYVRLWNYATGTAEDASVALDFSALAGGWAKENPVWAGDVERMFISLVAPGHTKADALLAQPQEGWAELSEIACEGAGSVLSIGDTLVPEHKLRIATGYDDLYHLTPERMLRNCLHLGYRALINHYVGMSHYFRLEAAEGLLHAGGSGAPLNRPCAQWHRDFAERARALGYELILSLSYELFDRHCPEEWKQRYADQSPALTGWAPPSTLLSPAHPGAMAYLQKVASSFAAIVRDCGLKVRFQVGEPWWWVGPDGRICLYDLAAVAAFAPVPIADVRADLSNAQKASLDSAGDVLAQSTSALCAAVRAAAPDAQTLLLVYLPTVLDGAEVRRANVPTGWAKPAFDILQLEDYDWVTSGNRGATSRGIAEAGARLGYPAGEQHYFSGFVLSGRDKAQCRPIAAAAEESSAGEVFVWALPQVIRDGFIWFGSPTEESDVNAFDDVRFPIALGREASVEPGFSTAIVTTANGFEQRNSDWPMRGCGSMQGPGSEAKRN